MTIDEVKKFRFLVKGWNVQTIEEYIFTDSEIKNRFFTKKSILRAGWVAVNNIGDEPEIG